VGCSGDDRALVVILFNQIKLFSTSASWVFQWCRDRTNCAALCVPPNAAYERRSRFNDYIGCCPAPEGETEGGVGTSRVALGCGADEESLS